MAETVNVRSTEAINEVHAALQRLQEEMREAIMAARLAAQNEREWIRERQRHWQRRVSSLAEELIEAEAALARCRSSRRVAGSDGCRAIADWAERTRRALADAESQLRTVRHWESVIDERITAFERRARILARELTSRVPLATTELTRLTDLLDGYADR